MFTVKYHLLRNRGRTLLLVLAAAILVGCVGLYLGNVLFARRALESLGDSVPVHVQVLSTDGERSSGIMIHSRQYDGLINGGVRKVRATSLAAGVYDEVLKAEAFTGGDTYILGVNCKEALPLKGYTFTYAPGESEACLGGTEAKCLVDAVYAGERGISPGEEMSLLLYLSVPGSDYVKVGEVSFTVAGTYAGKRKEESGISVVAPVGWLRAETEAAGQKFFCYDSVSAEVADPLRLNEFKAAMEEAGFFEPAPPEGGISSAVQVMGDALSVEDKLFIKAANQLEQNLLVYRVFFLPFTVLVVGVQALLWFLTLRGSRKEMAIVRALGQPRWKTVLSYLCSILITALLGCLLALPVTAAVTGISFALMICGVFLLCSVLGAGAALGFIFRFDAISMLVKAD